VFEDIPLTHKVTECLKDGARRTTIGTRRSQSVSSKAGSRVLPITAAAAAATTTTSTQPQTPSSTASDKRRRKQRERGSRGRAPGECRALQEWALAHPRSSPQSSCHCPCTPPQAQRRVRQASRMRGCAHWPRRSGLAQDECRHAALQIPPVPLQFVERERLGVARVAAEIAEGRPRTSRKEAAKVGSEQLVISWKLLTSASWSCMPPLRIMGCDTQSRVKTGTRFSSRTTYVETKGKQKENSFSPFLWLEFQAFFLQSVHFFSSPREVQPRGSHVTALVHLSIYL